MTRKTISLVLAVISGVLLIGVVSLRLWVQTYRIPQGAMEPTLPRGVHVMVARGGVPERGAIIAFRYPLDERYLYLFRVVATGGDLVEIRGKKLFVNGIAADERYAVHSDPTTYPNDPALPEPYRSRDSFGPYRVPPNHFFVLGDNRDQSSDSRYWGTVPSGHVIGRVILAYTWTRVWRPR